MPTLDCLCFAVEASLAPCRACRAALWTSWRLANRDERERFFESSLNRISGIALSKDVVIPYFGVQQAMGRHNAVQSIKLQDFPFAYSHENPFPHNERDASAVNKAFEDTFSAAASFLSAY